jgi:pulcherriminic acid synthase
MTSGLAAWMPTVNACRKAPTKDTAMTAAPDVLSPEFASDPYRFYKIMRDDFPLFFHDATRSWMVSRYVDVERAFKDPVFSS